MSTTHQYLVFEIHLSNLALVTSLQGSLIPLDTANGITGNGIGAILAAPDAAAIKYSAPKLAPHAEFVAPCITSSWFGTSAQFPTNVASFERCSGGWFGVCWLFGNKTIYHWRGIFVYAPPADVPGGPPIVPPLLARSWIDGFELPMNGEGVGSAMTCYSREASRHTEGFGLALRSSAVTPRNHLYTENGATASKGAWDRFYIRPRAWPTASTTFWRIRETVQANVGAALDILPAGNIAVYYVNSASAYTLLGTIPALTLDEWVRVDIVSSLTYASPGHENGFILTIYLNGIAKLTVTQFSTGSTSGTDVDRWSNSEIGPAFANTLAIDVDDWHGCCLIMGPPGLTVIPPATLGVEWINGSGIFPISPTGLDAATTPAAWTGDYRTLLQNPPDDGGATFTSATAAAALVVNTDALDICSAIPDTLGAVAITVALKATTVQAGATLGLVTTDTDVPSITGAIIQLGGNWMHFLWNKSGTAGAKPTGIVNLVFNHGAAGATTVKTLMAVAEVIGAFGPEDTKLLTPPPAVMPKHFGIHNSPYPSTPWARQTATPIQPVFLRSGTYTGNGTGQDLKFPVPIHFLWVRPLTAAVGGTRWYSSMIGPKTALQMKTPVDHMVRAMIDTTFVGGDQSYEGFPAPLPPPPATLVEAVDLSNRLAYGYPKNDAAYAGWAPYLTDPVYFFGRMLGSGAGGADIAPFGLYATVPSRWNTAQQQTLVRICGTDSQSNQAGIVYAYFAYGDPGMRFAVNGCIKDCRALLPSTTLLAHPSFTPIGGFFWWESPGSASTGAFYKGPGHAAASCSPLGGVEFANAVAFTGPTVVTQVGFTGAVADIAFALFRKDDGSGQAGKVVQIGSYTGDGNATRGVVIQPLSGKRPAWAMVVPHNGNAIYRDAQNTTNVSQQVSADATTTTGIVGGDIDSIIVGITLNAVGVIYDYLVFPGSDVAGNGGFSVPGDFFPVSPDAPPGAPNDGAPQEAPDAPVEDPSDAPSGGDPLAPTGPTPGLTDDWLACPVQTLAAVNLALSRLGSSQQVINLATDVTTEAIVARLVYGEAVQQTLRDFPWPFATRYAKLTLVATGPNSDWGFAYRQPTDCVFERRLVAGRGTALDPTPPPFQLSSDFVGAVIADPLAIPPIVGVPASGGGLIFCNVAGAVLEYTARTVCPLQWGDPLFRDAVAWRLVLAMAPSLSRMTDVTVDAAKLYAQAIELAREVIRPGNPGALPAAATIDLSPQAIAANVIVVNRALIRIGARTIASLSSEQSAEAQGAQLVFEDELQSTLRDFPWPFATAYVTPPLVAGTATVPVNPDWQYSYRLPADLVFARRLLSVAGAGRSYDPNPSTFRLGQDAVGKLLYTNLVDPQMEYTTRPEAAALIADALFRDALSWRLAATLAPSLAQIDPNGVEQLGRGPEDPRQPKVPSASLGQLRARVAVYAWSRYEEALHKAKIPAANEQQQDPNGEADWIAGR